MVPGVDERVTPDTRGGLRIAREFPAAQEENVDLPVNQTLVPRAPLAGKVVVGFGQFHSDPLPFDSVGGERRRSRSPERIQHDPAGG